MTRLYLKVGLISLVSRMFPSLFSSSFHHAFPGRFSCLLFRVALLSGLVQTSTHGRYNGKTLDKVFIRQSALASHPRLLLDLVTNM
jgi:hypothetical protein